MVIILSLFIIGKSHSQNFISISGGVIADIYKIDNPNSVLRNSIQNLTQTDFLSTYFAQIGFRNESMVSNIAYQLDFQIGYNYTGVIMDHSVDLIAVQHRQKMPLNIQVHLEKFKTLNPKFFISGSIGIGYRQFFGVDFIDKQTKQVGVGYFSDSSYSEGVDLDFRIEAKEYLNRTTFYLPIEIKLKYRFVDQMRLYLSLGYHPLLAKHIYKLDMNFVDRNNPSNNSEIVQYQKNNLMLEFGIEYGMGSFSNYSVIKGRIKE